MGTGRHTVEWTAPSASLTSGSTADAGFATEHLSDATGTVPLTNAPGQATAAEIHRVLNVVMHAQFAAVSTTDEWIDNVRNATATPIGNLLDSYNSSFASAAPR
ncbi:hypothetical protein ACQP1G_45450 [Nocardia sp. CA-107356]|uniref:hypothetical protein n=1 Tax=Nocardia sp. CA-107356 TaxID=3239972 RepID=UPI003D8B7F2F